MEATMGNWKADKAKKRNKRYISLKPVFKRSVNPGDTLPLEGFKPCKKIRYPKKRRNDIKGKNKVLINDFLNSEHEAVYCEYKNIREATTRYNSLCNTVGIHGFPVIVQRINNKVYLQKED